MTAGLTFEQIFRGRMVLMSAQRHIAQQSISYPNGDSDTYKFRGLDSHTAFFLVERLLRDLEEEFQARSKERAA